VAGYQAMQSLLASGPLPTAILATNDLVAMGAVEALNLAGIGVPDQISVIGYDDLGQQIKLPLTTVRSHPEQVGRIAAQVLIDSLTGNGAQNHIAVPTELVIRGTTAPPLA
jgi:DNA-binding LacI/PurR family transcriptional regulator